MKKIQKTEYQKEVDALIKKTIKGKEKVLELFQSVKIRKLKNFIKSSLILWLEN